MQDVVLLTGTPGTGKSTTARRFSTMSGFRVISINDVVGEEYLYIEKGSKVVDLNELSKKIKKMIRGAYVIEGHLAHLLDIDGMVIVLRTHPKELKKRLEKKGFHGRKLMENLEAEALDVCLVESLERHEKVFEIDTTDKGAGDVAGCILRIVQGDTKDFKPGEVSWLEGYFNSLEDL
jgi:adenylate kinase